MFHPDELVKSKQQKTSVLPPTREFQPDDDVWIENYSWKTKIDTKLCLLQPVSPFDSVLKSLDEPLHLTIRIWAIRCY